MGRGSDNNHVSFWFWFFALFIMAIPCIGPIMILIWAFAGDNESRKNYFRALLAWCLILIAISVAIMLLGFWPEIQRLFQQAPKKLT